jgi:hypothetical protein
MRRLLLLTAVVTVLVGLAPAGAADPDPTVPTWTRVTDTDGRNTDEVGVARTKDGVLHVLWRKETGASQEEIRHTPISAAGVVGTTTTATNGFVSVGNPDVVVLPDGSMRIFFGGLTTVSGGRNGVQSAIASAGAEALPWTLTGARVSSNQNAVTDVGAAVKPDGTPAFTYAYSILVGYHTGLNSNETDLNLVPENKCCGYLPDVAFEANGNGYVAWYSNVDGEVGTYVQQITPTLGTKELVPESSTAGKAIAPSQRTPIVARVGGGVYVAYCSGYPTCTRVLVWKVGSTTPIEIATGQDIESVTMSATPDGRLWVLWEDASARSLYASRTDDTATEPGAPVAFEAPAGTDTVWHLTSDATDDHLDALASVTVRTATASELATWHSQVLPGLAVAVKNSSGKAAYTVSDAGEPVQGAKIKAGKKTLTTDKAGKATGTKAPAEVVVSKTGYATMTVETSPTVTTTTRPAATTTTRPATTKTK